MTGAFKVGIWQAIDSDALYPQLQSYYTAMKSLILQSKSPNTHKLYDNYFRLFCKWCFKFKRSVLPADDFTVALYLTSLKDSNPSESKINASVYSISWAHSIAGLNDPCSSKLVMSTKEGLIRCTARSVIKKQAFTADDMRTLVKHYSSLDNLSHLRFITMCLLGFAGFLRFDELVNLKRSDVCIDKDQACLRIRHSKTDQRRQGSSVIIARTNTNTCPVKHLENYLIHTDMVVSSEQFLFRNIVYDKMTKRFVLKDGSHMSYTRAREILLCNIKAIGYDTKCYGLHSFRAGGATSAALSGVPDRLFKKHGRWKSENAKDGYVHEPESLKRSVSANLGI